MVSHNHLEAFLSSMSRGDLDEAGTHLSDEIELHSPILPAPIQGRAAVVAVLTQLLDTLDMFEPKLVLQDGADVVVMLAIRFKEHEIDAFDHVHLDEQGRIETMRVAWRPLPAVVAVQQALVPKLGGQAMRLVPAD